MSPVAGVLPHSGSISWKQGGTRPAQHDYLSRSKSTPAGNAANILVIAGDSALSKDRLDSAKGVPTLKERAEQTSAPKDDNVVTEKDYIDVKIDGVRSELRADVAELRADVRSLDARIGGMLEAISAKFEAADAKISALPSTWTLITTVASAAVATVTLIFVMLSYAGDQSDVASQQQAQITETRMISDRNAKQIGELNSKLDRVLTALERQEPPTPPKQ